MKRLINEQSEVLGPKTLEIVGLIIKRIRRNYVEIDKLIVRKSLSDHCFQSLCLLRVSTCMGEMRRDPNVAWMNQNEWYSQNNHFKELNRIDGMPTEFEWKICPGFTTLGQLKKIQDMMKDLQCGLEQFNDRIIFMSMYDDIVLREDGNTKNVIII